MKAAWEASSLIESLDLEVHLRYTVDGLHSFQKALDIYSVQDNILGTEIFVFWKFMHEPHYLHVSGVHPEQRAGCAHIQSALGCQLGEEYGLWLPQPEPRNKGLVPPPLSSLE